MTPSLAQRLWLRPVTLAFGPRRKLLSARAAFLLFAVMPTVALTAAFASGGATAVSFIAAGCSSVCAVVILLAYERLPAFVRPVFGAVSTATVTAFVVSQPQGELYAFLYVGIVFYSCLFFNRRRALAQVTLVVSSAGVAAFWTVHPATLVILASGMCIGSATITLLLRRQLLETMEVAERSRATLDAFFEHAAGGFAFLDGDLRFVRINDSLAALIGRPVDEIVGREIRDVSPHQADAIEPLLRATLETRKTVVGVEIASSDGKRHHLVDFYPITETDGICMSVVDVTLLVHSELSLTESNRQLTVLATTDELTGLPNRRMLSEQLELALARARRGGLAVAILSVDLDNFKSVNDSLGHAYGDQLLVEVARLLRAGARDTDVVARIGGDEFVVVLADLEVEDASETVETVLERIDGLLSSPISIGPVELRADASIGVALYPVDAREQEDLLAAADAAMYRRKQAEIRVA